MKLHECEHTIRGWRYIPTSLSIILALIACVNLFVGAMVGFTICSLGATWLGITAYLGHPFLPKKWLD